MSMILKWKGKLSPSKVDYSDEKSEPEDGAIAIPDEIYNWKMIVLAATAAAAAIIIGYDAGFIGGTVSLASFQTEFGMDKMSTSQKTLIEANVVSVFQAGAFWGALMIYPVGELIGRKIGLIISGLLLTIGAGISLIARGDRGLGAVYAGRVLTGVGIGGCSCLAPIYVSEISPTMIRGKTVGTWEVFWQVGGIVGYFINYGVLQNIPNSRKQWLIPFAVQLIPSGLFLIGSFLLPESPRFLIAKGKVDQARKNLAYLRNLPEDHPYSVFEMNAINKDINERYNRIGSGFLSPFKQIITSKKILFRLLLSTSLFIMQNGLGINAITYYSPTIFKSFGISGANTGLLSTGIFGLLKGCASVFWIFFVVEKLGRRTALMAFSLPCAICFYYIGAYIKIADPLARLASGNTHMDDGGRAAQAMLYIWTIFYGMSWNGTPWVINSEIFPQDIRTLTQAINAASNWFWAFIMGRFTGQAYNAIGYGLYILFGACSTVAPIIVFFFYPETKGVPLEAMDYLFEVPAWKAHKYALMRYESDFKNDVYLNEEDFSDYDSQDKKGNPEIHIADSERRESPSPN